MKEENLAIANVGEPTVRMTRARAAACHAFGGIPPSEALKQQGQKQVLRTSSKRAALDEMNSSASAAAPVQHKRRAVLKDVTNVCCENSYKNCLIAAKIPARNFRFHCGLVYVSEPGYMLFRAGVPRHAIIKKFGAAFHFCEIPFKVDNLFVYH
ncbi:unnamed protein product [Camellia sinensis]